jgi:hypothetical protein
LPLLELVEARLQLIDLGLQIVGFACEGSARHQR